jgi:hypothetical protein
MAGGEGASGGGGQSEFEASNAPGPGVSGFGVTNPNHEDTALNSVPGFHDLRGLSPLDRMTGPLVDSKNAPGFGFSAFDPGSARRESFANYGATGLLNAMTGQAGIPGLGGIGLQGFGGGAKAGQAVASAAKGMGMTGTAQGFPGGGGPGAPGFQGISPDLATALRSAYPNLPRTT